MNSSSYAPKIFEYGLVINSGLKTVLVLFEETTTFLLKYAVKNFLIINLKSSEF